MKKNSCFRLPMKATWNSGEIEGKAKVDFVTLTLGIKF
jgi:hypothetical protein